MTTFKIVSYTGEVLESGILFGNVLSRHNYWWETNGIVCQIVEEIEQ